MTKLSNLQIKAVSSYGGNNDHLIDTTLDINGVTYEVAISKYPNGWFILSTKKVGGKRYSSFSHEKQAELVDFILDNYKNETNEEAVVESTIEVKAPTKAEQKEARKVEIINEIQSIIDKHGNELFTENCHTSASGMLRSIKVYVSNQFIEITDLIAELQGYTFHKTGGLKVTGCGMDMGFHVVYNLASKMYKGMEYYDEYGHKREVGYMLKQRWI